MNPEDICNMALDMIGYQRAAIGDMTEGTRASRVALRLYSITRDETLRAKDWPFASRTITLTLIKSAGTPIYNGGAWNDTFPQPPWVFEYAYPDDCLLLRYVRTTPTSIPTLDPKPVLFSVSNDADQPTKTILTNQQDALGVYTARITNPAFWEPLFIEALVQALAKKFSITLAQSPDLLKEKVAESQQAIDFADTRGG